MNTAVTGSVPAATHLRLVPERGRRPGARPVRATAPRATTGMRLTRRGRVVVTALAVCLALAAGSVAQHASARTPGEAVPVAVYTVAGGETLWHIASGLTEPGEDVRETVALLMQLNGLASGALDAGQQLLVPAA